jgi:trehalose 6-phosphate phosphatase
MDTDRVLDLLGSRPERTGIFTDFDGTLSEIVDRPEDAVPVDGVVRALSDLARRFAVVGVVSGRSLDDLRARLAPDGVVLAGSYGRERSDRSSGRRPSEGWEPVAAAAAAMISDLPGVVLERKGAGIALHYRTAPAHEQEVRRRAAVLAEEFELQIMQGRLVSELVRAGPGKADAVAALASEHDLEAVLVAGDDVADIEVFDWARTAPLRSVVVGVASEEAPASLVEKADLVVSSPRELLELLRRLG